jgi:predicted transcriptional regulator of viral defense system
MATLTPTQEQRAISLLRERGIVRPSELSKLGITAATLSRMSKRGIVHRLGRGLYQLADADLDANHSLAEVAKRVPKGVICLASALAFHELTDTIPSRVWIAIGAKDRRPSVDYPPLQVVRFGDKVLHAGLE